MPLLICDMYDVLKYLTIAKTKMGLARSADARSRQVVEKLSQVDILVNDY